MRLIPLVLLVAGLSVGCGQPNNSSETPSAPAGTAQNEKTQSELLSEWFADKYEEQLQFSPITLTNLGRKDQYDQIDDMSEAAQKAQLDWQGKTVKELKSRFDYASMTDDEKISYDIWMTQYKNAKSQYDFRRQGYILTQMGGLHAFLPNFLINFHKVETAEDMDAYISRIAGVSRAIGQLLERAQLGAEAGVRAPYFAYDGVIEQSQNLLTGVPFDESDKDAPLWADAKNKVAALKKAGTIDDAAATAFEEKSRAALVEHFGPAYSELVAWYQKDKANVSDQAQGVSALPNGKAFYKAALAQQTTTSLSEDEIHNIGLAEVARIRAEMEAIKDKVKFEGDLKAFFEFIKTDDQFFYPNTDEGRQGYLDDSTAYLDYIKSKLPEYFGLLPKADLVVKRVEAFREQDGAAQHYFPGTPDGSRPGVYYAHLSDMRSMPKNEMEAIAYHEGSPGHHMQISIAQELEGVPQFRTQAFFTAYIEGWALYSELLAKEMGAYENPYSDFGRNVTEIWRAIRLVVDTGIHAKGWTEEQAINYMADNSPIAMGQIKSEIHRYFVLPGQATSYKIGMIKIQELRAKAEAELGDKFDIRQFHDTVLGGGAVPLPVLEQMVNSWIAKSK